MTYKLGAPEILLDKEFENLINKKAQNGERVLAFVKEENKENIPILFISLKNEIRKNAKEIFGFFNNRNVKIRVISGDNPTTVSSIAKQAGIKGYEKYVDCRELECYEDIKRAVKKYNIFGRVNPEQKKQIIKALKELGFEVQIIVFLMYRGFNAKEVSKITGIPEWTISRRLSKLKYCYQSKK